MSAEYQRAYYEANREAIRARMKAYYAANREECIERAQAYYEANRERVLAEGKRRRASGDGHGTRRAYREGCRCGVCVAEQAQREFEELCR